MVKVETWMPAIVGWFTFFILGILVGLFVGMIVTTVAIRFFVSGIILAIILAILIGAIFGKGQADFAWGHWHAAFITSLAFSCGFMLPGIGFSRGQILTNNLPCVLITVLGIPLASCLWYGHFIRRRKKQI
ncbi:hypothetical protein C4546_03275 [Candidatus Parcubacteria bacterium]|jgi:hypothetical protein|nr:MAG: hypothetical protein C4546_03275 [Candidatus Parcubacteria bacterium]